MTWRDAFLAQARSDFGVFMKLSHCERSPCHKLHYLQMATEKLAKAYLCHFTGAAPQTRHPALTEFLQRSKGRPELRRKLGYGRDYHAYVSYIDNLLPFARGIERLAPTGDPMQMNPEYPWRDDKGRVMCPSLYSFPEFPKNDLAKFLVLVFDLFRVAD